MDEKTIQETAKAAQEAAKLGSNVVNTGRAAGSWLDRIFGEAIAETVALHWTDKVKARRVQQSIFDWERLTLLERKVQARLGDVVNLRPVPPKIAIPLLEHATMEHDDDLHTLWANLLASAMIGDSRTVERQFVSVLADLSAEDAIALSDFYARWREMDKTPNHDGSVTYGAGFNGLDFGDLVARNLFRLGLIEQSSVTFHAYKPGADEDYNAVGLPKKTQEITLPGDLTLCRITQTGMDFCKAIGLDEAS